MDKDYFKSKKYTQYLFINTETKSITWTSHINLEISAKRTMLITYHVSGHIQEYSKTTLSMQFLSAKLSRIVRYYEKSG